MAISFVAKASTSSTTNNSTFVLPAPAGIAAGDLLVALVAVYPGGGGAELTFTAPSGWTKVGDQFSTSRPPFPTQIGIFTKVATGSEPATWSGSYNRSLAGPEVLIVSAYRGANGVLTTSTSQTGGGTALNTPTVNNTLDGSWRLVVGAYAAGSLDAEINSNELVRRDRLGAITGGGDALRGILADSGAVVATGNTSRNISASGSGWDSACSGIMIIKAANVDPSSGDFACQLPKLTSEVFAEAVADGPIDADLPLLQVAFEGEGVPQPSSGGFDCTTPALSAGLEGGSDIVGQIGTVLGVVAEFVGETVPFGIRVIAVEAENRTIEVPSRGVEA